MNSKQGYEAPLEKGTQFTYVVSERDLDIYTLIQRELEDQELINGYWHIPCFISGDTDEEGTSIVALDNPEVCVYRSEGRIFIQKGRKYLRDCGGIIKADDIIMTLDSTGQPVCPYAK